MTRLDFEKKIKKEIDQHLNVKVHPQNLDVAGVYYNDIYICAIPSGDIYEERNPNYQDAVGNVHRPIPEAIAMIGGFIHQVKNDPEFLELMTEKPDAVV